MDKMEILTMSSKELNRLEILGRVLESGQPRSPVKPPVGDSYGQAAVPAVVPEGPGGLPKALTKKPKSGKPTVQPGIGSL